jgi:hypothetical protein
LNVFYSDKHQNKGHSNWTNNGENSVNYKKYKIKGKTVGKCRKLETFHPLLYKMETMLEKEDKEF